jgi:hypothetical protein
MFDIFFLYFSVASFYKPVPIFRNKEVNNNSFLYQYFVPFCGKIKSKMKKFSTAFLKCIRETQVTSLRAGKDRTKFTGIWMVEVEGRIFGRSYKLSERSWYTSFLSGDDGDLKCGNEIVPVKGVKPADLDTVTKAINEAYEKKYLVRGSNKKWVDGLTEPKRVERTMEFIPV